LYPRSQAERAKQKEEKTDLRLRSDQLGKALGLWLDGGVFWPASSIGIFQHTHHVSGSATSHVQAVWLESQHSKLYENPLFSSIVDSEIDIPRTHHPKKGQRRRDLTLVHAPSSFLCSHIPDQVPNRQIFLPSSAGM